MNWQERLLLVADSALVFLRLLTTETTLAIAALPEVLLLSVLRIPMLLLTWIGFTLLAACAVYALTGMVVAAAATGFLLQLLATLWLERVLRRARRQCSFPESRKVAGLIAAGVHEQIKRFRGSEEVDENKA